MSNTYPIHEMFDTFQGEGVHMGKPAFFIRTYGCPVHCPWCDSAGTWHPDWIPKDVSRMTPEQIVKSLPPRTKIVIITGGEPTIFNLNPLVDELHMLDIQVHLETSGGFPIQGELDWITLSPKKWRHPIPSALVRADEFKFIIETEEDIDFYWKLIQMPNYTEDRPIWLHPEWSQHKNSKVLEAICEAVKDGEGQYRAGWQLHKCYGVDLLDKRSRPMVPLGGDYKRGF